jgi:hypothetical protein
MTVPKVFIASSSEGLGVVKLVHKLLQRDLSETAEVTPWPEQFQLTKAYIESLERLLDTSDFVVLVLTPDDLTTSREANRLSPRDNVVFEVGLFFGRLGRDRCFLIKRGDLDLKLPSDLLGIESAMFSISPGQDLETALDPACARIGMAIRDAMTTLPSRPRLSDAERAAQAAMRRFGDRIIGTWWERIRLKGEAPALSFLTIELDDVHSSVRLGGKAYGPDGAHVARWRSAAARLEGKRVVYVRECMRFDPAAKTTAWLPGLGEVTFDDSSDVIDQGDGKFWESDESRPEETVIKFVDLRRSRNESHTLTMLKGSEGERQALVRERLGSW